MPKREALLRWLRKRFPEVEISYQTLEDLTTQVRVVCQVNRFVLTAVKTREIDALTAVKQQYERLIG